MANTLRGAPTVAQVQLLCDQLSTPFKNNRGALGLNALGEAATLASDFNTARLKILGDGGANYGLGNPDWINLVKSPLDSCVQNGRWDILFSRLMRTGQGFAGLMASLNSQVSANLPSGWVFTNATILQYLDSWLTRINGAYGASVAQNPSGALATPPSIGVLTAGYNAAGALPVFASGNCPRCVHTLVGAQDWYESLPSALATQIALAAPNNSLTYQIPGVVVAGTKAVRVYRGVVGGGAGIYYLDQTVRTGLVVGAAFPAITLLNTDQNLRTDWIPPAWACCLIGPEAAVLFALALSAAGTGTIDAQLLQFAIGNMVSPWNVALNPSGSYPTNLAGGFLGLGNPAQSGQYGIGTLTGAATATFVAGTIQGVNNPGTNIQGFAGGIGCQARVTTALAAAGTVTLNFVCYDSIAGWGTNVPVNGIAAAFGGTTLGSLATFAIPNDANGNKRIVQSVTLASVSGFSSATGVFVVESPQIRSW
jgi:hypothetical protein